MAQLGSVIRILQTLSAAALLLTAVPAAGQPDVKPPAFTYDLDWLKVPAQWRVGDISAVAVDTHDNVWVLHRPRTLSPDQRAQAAPPVLEFDGNGKFIRGWGGEGAGYEWPLNEHSLFVDAKDRVWLSGSSRTPGASDDAILAFTADGRFLRQIGHENASRGDADTADVKAVADIYVDAARNELYAADGYGNHRVIVFDTETGAFKRMWGAFGRTDPARFTQSPNAVPLDDVRGGSIAFSSVHGVELARDGQLYVSDRDSQRVQVFDRQGRYRSQVFVGRGGASPQTASGLALSPDKAQRWLYVVDFGNNRLFAFDRRTLTQAAEFGGTGKAPGQFIGPHLIAMDSRGVLYVAEVQGRRLQRLVPK